MENQFLKKTIRKIIFNRRIRNFSQEQLALTATVALNYVWKLEKLCANPSVRILKKLSRTLKTTVYELTKEI